MILAGESEREEEKNSKTLREHRIQLARKTVAADVSEKNEELWSSGRDGGSRSLHRGDGDRVSPGRPEKKRKTE